MELFAEQIISSFLLINIPSNFCKQFYFFCSTDTKQIFSMSGTPLFNQRNVNMFARFSLHFNMNLRNGFSCKEISENRKSCLFLILFVFYQLIVMLNNTFSSHFQVLCLPPVNWGGVNTSTTGEGIFVGVGQNPITCHANDG